MSDIRFPFSNVTKLNQPQSVEPEELVRYWHSLRGETGLPRRSEVDPRAIAGLLPYTFIVETIAPGLVRFRVAGTHFADLAGMDVRGMPLSALLEPEARPDMAQALEQMFEAPAILHLSLKSPTRLGQPGLKAQGVILPLRDEVGEVTRAIGCLKAHGSIGKAPRRFGVTSSRLERISVAGKDQPKPPAQTNHPAASKPGAAPYLRLVVSDNHAL